MPKVYNIQMGRVPKHAVLVDRSTVWGNPYRMRGEDTRDTVITQFEIYAMRRMQEEPEWLTPLKGKDVVCHCAPKRCHGDILVRLANETE